MTDTMEAIPKREQILELIKTILMDNEIDAKDVILIAEEIKTDALITICVGLAKNENKQ